MLNKRRIYEFDDFRVDTGQFFLTRAGRAEPITPTVFRILLMLLEHAGEVVTKEDLMKNVWPDSFVEEGNLNRNVSTLRKALGEKPCDHRCIETIPKTGYRFIAPTRVTEYKPPAGTARKIGSHCIQHIVGREIERDILQRTYDQVQQGRGALVCINGDVGLGKTSLVDAFVEDLFHNGQTCHLARSRCSDSFIENEPLMPWIENVTALTEEPTVSEALVKTAPTWHREISHSGSSGQRRMKRELLDFYKEISSVHPVIIVLDDFHWADVGSVDLLAFLAPRLESLRVMVIVCYRQAEMKIKSHPFLQVRSDLLSRGSCTEILLARLSRNDVEQYVALEQPNENFAPDYAETLHTKSEGNPLFMRELLHEPNGKSESIQHLIQSRLDRLDDTHHQLLVTASVQGREFDSAVLAAAMQMNSQDVEESLQMLDDVYGLIRRTREEELPDGKFTVRYRFVYQLYQEACYSSLAPTRKASLSASLAEAFLTYYGN